MTDAAESVVNGMSPSGRTSPYANSGLVTEVRLSDFEYLRPQWGELAGLKFQQAFEVAARREGGAHQIGIPFSPIHQRASRQRRNRR